VLVTGLDEYFKTSTPWLKVLFWLLAAAVALFALRQLAPILVLALDLLSPFLVALIVAYVFHPIVSFTQEKLKLGRTAGILVVGALIVLLIGGVSAWLAPVLYQQITAGLSDLSNSVEKIVNSLTAKHLDAEARAQLEERFREFVANLDGQIKGLFMSLGGTVGTVAEGSVNVARSVAGGIAGVIKATGGIAASFIFVVIIAFYYLADMDDIPRVIRKALPARHHDRIWAILLKGDRAVGGFMRGQLIVCAFVGALTSVLLFLIGMKQYAILIGCFAGLMNLIPYLGSVAGFLPGLLWILFTGSLDTMSDRGVHIIYLLAGFGAIQALDAMVFQPLIVGRGASLHPLAVMLALAVGSRAGLGGMILAVPVACFAKVLWMELYWSKRPDVPIEGATQEPRAGPPKPTPLPRPAAPSVGPGDGDGG